MPHRIVVVGGAGAMGRIIARDLAQFFRAGSVVVADYDVRAAQDLVRTLGRHRASAAQVDVTDRKSMARALAGAFAVVNAAPYQWNLEVMEAALAARTHYVDLGGLFHMTRKQLLFAERFRKAGRLALLGMGAAPGITNILASVGAQWLDRVREIHLRLGSRDLSRYRHVPALPVSYSLQTILEEFSYEPAVFTRGKFAFVEPMSGREPHRFPEPVGLQRPFYTLHSEVATLPLSFAAKGVREVSFKIAFDDAFVDRVGFLRDMGFGSHDEIAVRGAKVRPIEVANRVAMSQRPAERVGPLRQHEVVRAIVRGTRGGKKKTVVLDCFASGMPEWGVGTDVDTGSPPAIAVEMLAAGEITAVGVLPPELTVPPEPFFARLAKRRMKVEVRTRSGWEFAV